MNLFGVPRYLEAYPGCDFCDFNLIRVVVCPCCFFASNDINEFDRISTGSKEKSASFGASAISKQWLEKKDERKNLVADCLPHFFDEERSLKQAILAYQLAIISSDEIFKIDEGRRPRLRNYNSARKSTYFLFVKAELLMRNSEVNEAENTLKEVIRRLEFIFPMLTNEFSIRSAYLLGLLNVYFGEYRQAGKYLIFLNEYNKNDSIQNRDDFSKATLTGFDGPY